MKINSQKLISNYNYTMNKSPLDEGIMDIPKPKRVRRTKHTFKLTDIKKADVKNSGFATKKQAFKFMTDVLDKKYTDFKTKDELINYIQSKKDKLNKHIDLSDYGRKGRTTKKGKQYSNNTKLIEEKLNKHDQPKKIHITAEIKRSIKFTKKKW